MARTIGTIQCKGYDCGEKVAVTETAGASLSCKCAFCGLSSYAPPGTKEARNIRKRMAAFDDPEPAKPAPAAAAPAAPAAAAPAPPAAPTKARKAFSFDQL